VRLNNWEILLLPQGCTSLWARPISIFENRQTVVYSANALKYHQVGDPTLKPNTVIFVLFLICSFAASAFTQANTSGAPPRGEKPKTDLEAFQEKYGAVIVKGYSELPAIRGSSGTFQITIREFRNPGTNSKVKGLVVEIDPDEKYASSARSFVEYAEIDSLIKGIVYISKIDKSVTTLTNFEAEYKTKGSFSVTVFNSSAGGIRASLEVGSYGSKSIFVSTAELDGVVTQLQQAKAMLDAL
jgi:hypothetical protein